MLYEGICRLGCSGTRCPVAGMWKSVVWMFCLTCRALKTLFRGLTRTYQWPKAEIQNQQLTSDFVKSLLAVSLWSAEHDLACCCFIGQWKTRMISRPRGLWPIREWIHKNAKFLMTKFCGSVHTHTHSPPLYLLHLRSWLALIRHHWGETNTNWSDWAVPLRFSVETFQLN